MRDIDYAFFSQMSYLNWENLSKRNIEEAGSDDLVANILDKKELWNILSPSVNLKKKELSEYLGNDKRVFMRYSLEESKKPVFSFLGWKFLFGTGYSDIYRLYLKKTEKIPNNRYKGSFRGVVFKKKNKIVIAFNGGEKLIDIKKNEITLDDMKIYERNCAHLIAGYWLYEYVQENYFEEGDEIHLTGNKYGGFIAQYVYMAAGGKDRTVLWNPIGSGINSEIKDEKRPPRELSDLRNIWGHPEFTKEVIERIYSKFILEDGWVSPAILEENAKDKIRQAFEEAEEKKKIKKIAAKKIENKEDPTEHIEVLYYILLTNYLYNDDYERKRRQSLIQTYLIEDEWAVHAINRIGAVIDISTGIRTERRRVKRKKALPYELPFLTEELNDVIIFINNYGNLEYGVMREEFVKNSIKSVIMAKMKILMNDNIIVKNGIKLEIKRETLEYFDIKYYSAGVLTPGRTFGLERKLNPDLFKYMKVMRDNILNLKEPYKIVQCDESEPDYKEYIELGEYSNLKSLGNIKCSQPLKIYIAE